MPEDNVLKLINSLEQLPLINFISKKGYESYILHVEPLLVYTFLKHTGERVNNNFPEPFVSAVNSDEMAKLIKLLLYKNLTNSPKT